MFIFSNKKKILPKYFLKELTFCCVIEAFSWY